MSNSEPFSRPTPQEAQTVRTRAPARVPRRFAAGTLMILIAVYGLIIRGLMAIGAPTAVVVTIAGVLTAAGVAQVVLFRGERPRYASIVFGAIAAPSCASVYAFVETDRLGRILSNQTVLQVVTSGYYLLIGGAILGYVSGCIAAGLFLLLGRIRWFQVDLQLDHTTAPTVAAKAETRGWLGALSHLSLFQLERPLREFGATMAILLAGFAPLAIYMPWWRATVYLQVVVVAAMCAAFFRTGARLLRWPVTLAFLLFSLLCAIGPATMASLIHWSGAFLAELAVGGVLLLSCFAGAMITAAFGWRCWIRRTFTKRQTSAVDRIVLAVMIILANMGAVVYLASRLRQPDQVALRRIRQLGGGVSHSFPSVSVFGAHVSSVDLFHIPVTDDDLQLMTALSKVEELDISSSRITDSGLQHLHQFTQLRSLHVDSDQVTDGGIRHLARIRTLKMLSLSGTQITVEGLRALNSANLRVLSISGSALDSSALEQLSTMSILQQLILTDADLSGADLSILSQVRFLKLLNLSRCNLHDEDLKGLALLPQLEHLMLAGNPLTDESIARLKSRKLLERIDLSNTRVTQAGVEQLDSQLPNCAVICR